MYSASWCAPCQSAKRALNNSKLPFDIDYVDVAKGGQPNWCSTIPAFSWDVRGQTRYVLGFSNAGTLVKTWESSQKPVKVSAHYSPSWSYPGEIRHHLQQSHGVSEAGSLTREQAEQLHDALHNGVSLPAIKRYAVSKGLITQ
jgi:hypothetical protein